jgi:hypothetical protein
MQIYKALPCLTVLLLGTACFGANDDQLLKLDGDRNDLLKQIINELSYGHMQLADAQRTKCELDKIVSLETAYKEGRQIKLSTISLALQKVRDDVKDAIHTNKVWMGIDSSNMALRKKIDANFSAHKLTKEEAENLGKEEQTLRARETVNDATNGLEYNDAEALAKEIQQLDKKIDELSSQK